MRPSREEIEQEERERARRSYELLGKTRDIVLRVIGAAIAGAIAAALFSCIH